MRPLLRWFLFTFCLLVFTGAMGWISLRMLDLETQRRLVEEDAQVQEKTRLALWRMDSLVSTLLIRENSRPAYHYQAFFEPDDLFASATQAVPKGQVVMPSPLFGSLPDLVRLHFEKVPGQPALTSPQAPAGKEKEMATAWYALGSAGKAAAQTLTELETLVQNYPEIQQVSAAGSTALIEVKPTPPPVAEVDAKQSASIELSKDLQSLSNAREQNQRALVINGNVFAEKKELQKPQIKKIAPPPTAKASKEEPKLADAESLSKPDSAAMKSDALSGAQSASSWMPYGSRSEQKPTPSRQTLPSLAGDLQPFWAGQELLLVRHATVDGIRRLQGVWLDWPSLQARMLDIIRDLLPEASLQPIAPAVARHDVASLVTLPVRLVPGKVPVLPLEKSSALRPALGVAWACLITASLAIAYVLHRAVLLSERRGAFVSAVTHELRTPLTTFRLYSEMLADDMVPDAARRRTYLQTLCDESTRLMHLVENVLAYSRIERGRTAGRMENIQVKSLLDRIVPRLEQRASQADLTLHLMADDLVLQTHLRVDAMAVEQILFNLTDNACKYAAPDCDPRRLDLTVTREKDILKLVFRDHGPGLPLLQKKRLFQPFSKSATDAAHSAPGVGLGLALSRQLARELKGELSYMPPQGRGAAFCLTLKV